MIDQLRHLASNIHMRNGDLSEAAICERAAHEIEVLRNQVESLKRDADVWKDRWQAADQALNATIKDFNSALSNG